mmetsp:Transcript_22545/g.38337  ORF Transcript_22545/g.38337 Transcript_22545/m.38337 type:complete len:208 (-) Transcript_22545:198-821(-)
MKQTATILAFLALAATTCNVVSGFGYYGSGLRVFRPSVVVNPSIARKRTPLWRKIDACRESCPRYELTDNDEKFQVAIDVPGVDMKDIKVNLEEDGKLLTVTGERKSSKDSTYTFSSKFYTSFTLDPAVDVDKFTANLKNGVLIIAAPKDMKRIETNIRAIPISTIDDSASVVSSEVTENKTDEDSTVLEITAEDTQESGADEPSTE